mgnify:CR=1 FL=1
MEHLWKNAGTTKLEVILGIKKDNLAYGRGAIIGKYWPSHTEVLCDIRVARGIGMAKI